MNMDKITEKEINKTGAVKPPFLMVTLGIEIMNVKNKKYHPTVSQLFSR
jgi:hypothetical protein